MPLLLDLPDQTPVDPKPDSIAKRTPFSWMHSTTGRGRDGQSLDSDVLVNKKRQSTRSATSVPQGCRLILTEFSVGTGHYRYPIHLQPRATQMFNVSEILHTAAPDDEGNV